MDEDGNKTLAECREKFDNTEFFSHPNIANLDLLYEVIRTIGPDDLLVVQSPRPLSPRASETLQSAFKEAAPANCGRVVVMEDDLTVDRIASVQPGDVMIVRSERPISDKAYIAIQSMFRNLLPKGVKVLVFDCGLTVNRLCDEELESLGLQRIPRDA